jgi:hypothetical protein
MIRATAPTYDELAAPIRSGIGDHYGLTGIHKDCILDAEEHGTRCKAVEDEVRRKEFLADVRNVEFEFLYAPTFDNYNALFAAIRSADWVARWTGILEDSDRTSLDKLAKIYTSHFGYRRWIRERLDLFDLEDATWILNRISRHGRVEHLARLMAWSQGILPEHEDYETDVQGDLEFLYQELNKDQIAVLDGGQITADQFREILNQSPKILDGLKLRI